MTKPATLEMAALDGERQVAQAPRSTVTTFRSTLRVSPNILGMLDTLGIVDAEAHRLACSSTGAGSQLASARATACVHVLGAHRCPARLGRAEEPLAERTSRPTR